MTEPCSNLQHERAKELSRNNVSTLHGVRAEMRPVPFMEDVVVPPPALPDFLRRLQEVLKQHQATAMLLELAFEAIEQRQRIGHGVTVVVGQGVQGFL